MRISDWSSDVCSSDLDRVEAGTVLATLAGHARALVTGERTALNFMQTLSGTATVTAAYVDAVRGTRTRILDTRKTIPGLRAAQKYAVRTGGGSNHRMGLRSEEHTSELQSLMRTSYAVFCLKKKKKITSRILQ